MQSYQLIGLINMSEKNPEGKPLAFKTVKALEDAVEKYFKEDAYMGEGEDRVYAPTMSGLALSLGVDRRTIVNYAHREAYFPTIKKARARVEVYLEQRLYGNNVTGTIFNLKNNFDWKDKTESALTGADGGAIQTDNTWTIKVVE